MSSFAFTPTSPAKLRACDLGGRAEVLAIRGLGQPSADLRCEEFVLDLRSLEGQILSPVAASKYELQFGNRILSFDAMVDEVPKIVVNENTKYRLIITRMDSLSVGATH